MNQIFKRILKPVFCSVLLCLAALSGCSRNAEMTQAARETAQPESTIVTVQVAQTPQPSAIPQNTLKYVFLFIGDGMGPNQVRATNEALEKAGLEPLCFTSFPVSGAAITNNVDGKTTDSAAAATALACGQKTINGALGQTQEGNRLAPLPQTLRERGWKAGILTTVSMDNATPAGFYAHTDSRKNYSDILKDLLASGYEYFAGGGFHSDCDPETALQAGYQIAVGETAADKIADSEKLILIGDTLTEDKGLPLALDDGNNREGQLARNVARGIRRLCKDNPVFFMVEGGRIDLAGHYHDAGDLLAEMRDFDDAIQEALDFYQQHPYETLILVTADHETGGLTLSKGDRTRLMQQEHSCDRFDEIHVSLYRELGTSFEDALQEIETAFGLNDLTPEEAETLRVAYNHTISDDLSAAKAKEQYGVYTPVTSVAEQLLAKRAGLSYTTTGHTSENVPVYALGVGQELFAGTYENTQIPEKLLSIIKTSGAE